MYKFKKLYLKTSVARTVNVHWLLIASGVI